MEILGRGKDGSWVAGDFKIIGGNFRGGLGQVFYYYFKALFLGWGRVGWGGDFFPFFSMAWEKLFGWLKIFF